MNRWHVLSTAVRPCISLRTSPCIPKRNTTTSSAIRDVEAAIPVINVAGLRALGQENEHRRRKIGGELVAAASEVGFFYVTDHGIQEALLSEARDFAREFFHLPMAAKERLSIREEPSRRGYQFVGENITQGRPDQHEAFDLYRDMPPVTPAQARAPTNHGVNKWPAELPQMQPFFQDRYVSAMHDLGGVLMRGIALGLELHEQHFQPFFTSSFWIMRLIRYPPAASAARQSGMGCGVHTDYGILTLLNQDLNAQHARCLQAQMRDGSWVSVPPKEGALAVNIGDMLALWTGGRLRATPHRVSSPQSSDRVAVPFFFEPNYDALIAPLDLAHLRDDRGIAEPFEPIRYGKHLLGKVATNFDL